MCILLAAVTAGVETDTRLARHIALIVVEAFVSAVFAIEVARCELHPGLKAPLVSKVQPKDEKLALST